VKKHFFSLIDGKSIRIAPETKFIPAAQFSTLVDAENILIAAKDDAEKYKIQVTTDCEALKEEAEKQGFEHGFQSWVEHIAKLEKEIQTIRKDLEKMIIPIALKAAKKIVGREIELSEETIVDIVLNYLKAVSTHKKIIIYVSRKDLTMLEKNRTRLKDAFEGLETLSIRERADIEPGGCVIETEGGIINAKLKNQWEVMEKAFKSLMKEHSQEIQK
jgi:type III secretion protein L